MGWRWEIPGILWEKSYRTLIWITKEKADSYMDEKNSQTPAPEEDDPPGLAANGDNEVSDTEEKDHPSHSDSNQTEHYVWGLPWDKFVNAAVASIAIVATFIGVIVTASLRWHADITAQTYARQKSRAHIILSTVDTKEPGPTISLILKNVGETTALNSYGAWLQGECQGRSSHACAEWCMRPLPGTKGTDYGPVLSQGELPKHTFSPTKSRRIAGKNRPPFYICGHITYTDVFCVQWRYTRCVYYDPPSNLLRSCPTGNKEEEVQKNTCPQ